MKTPIIDQLAQCECCPRKCRVDRTLAEGKFCRMGTDIRVAHIGLHFGEEPPISGSSGSGTIFFAGCNLRCVFCQNYQISQEFQPAQLRILTGEELVDEMLKLQLMGAHNVNFVSPTHMILQMADAIEAARGKGFHLPVVYNSNGYDSLEMLQTIKGLVDIYLPDIKYMDNVIARKYSSAPHYAEVIPGVLREMLDQVGHLRMDENGIASGGLLVRHLVLPGEIENSLKCLDLLAEISTEIHASIMSQYSPQYKAGDFPEINRTLTPEEYEQVVDYAWELGLENAYIQEMQSRDHNLPDFEKEKPFDFTISNA